MISNAKIQAIRNIGFNIYLMTEEILVELIQPQQLTAAAVC